LSPRDSRHRSIGRVDVSAKVLRRNLTTHSFYKNVVRVIPGVGLVKKFNTEPRESALEAWFVRTVRKHYRGKAYKFSSPGHRSVPDRIVIFKKPNVKPHEMGHLFLVELKRRGKKPTPKQWGEINFWRMMGFRVYVCDTKESCLDMLETEWRLCFLH